MLSSFNSHRSLVPAKCNTVFPFSFNECISVPASSSSVTTGTWLEMMARWMGKLLTQSLMFGFAPKSRSRRTMSRLPRALAIWRQVRCLSSQLFTSCMFVSSKSFSLTYSLFETKWKSFLLWFTFWMMEEILKNQLNDFKSDKISSKNKISSVNVNNSEIY